MRRSRLTGKVVALSALLSCASSFARVPSHATQTFLEDHSGALPMIKGKEGLVALYGTILATDSDPGTDTDAFVEAFLATDGNALGVDGAAFQIQNKINIRNDKFTVYTYVQIIEGLPVHASVVKIPVLLGPMEKIPHVSLRLFQHPDGPLPGDVLSAAEAVAAVAQSEDYGHLTDFTPAEDAEKVIYEDGEGTLHRTWRFSGRDEDESYQFLVDTSSGNIVGAHDQIFEGEASGTVSGYTTPRISADVAPDCPDCCRVDPNNPTGPDCCLIPTQEEFCYPAQDDTFDPVVMPMTGIQVTLVDGQDEYEQYAQLPNAGYLFSGLSGGEVLVGTQLTGRWVTVLDGAGYDLPLSATPMSDPPAVVDFTFNELACEGGVNDGQPCDPQGNPETECPGGVCVWDNDPVCLGGTNDGLPCDPQGDVRFECPGGTRCIRPFEFATAQVNAFHVGEATHDWFTDLQPAFTGIDRSVPIWVNSRVGLGTPTCSNWVRMAKYEPFSDAIFLGHTLQGCAKNAAYSTIISHEYGHFILDQILGFIEYDKFLAFHEGTADTVAELMWDTELIGLGWLEGAGSPDPVRNIDTPDQVLQFGSCEGAYHACGQALSGAFWDLRKLLGDQATEELFADFLFITDGFLDESVLVEVLVANDNDGDLGSTPRTPDEEWIGMVFQGTGVDQHGWPTLDEIFCDGPDPGDEVNAQWDGPTTGPEEGIDYFVDYYLQDGRCLPTITLRTTEKVGFPVTRWDVGREINGEPADLGAVYANWGEPAYDIDVHVGGTDTPCRNVGIVEIPAQGPNNWSSIVLELGGRCIGGGNSGSPCDQNADCPGGYCSTGDLPGTCVGGGTPGQACASPEDCSFSSVCSAGNLAWRAQAYPILDDQDPDFGDGGRISGTVAGAANRVFAEGIGVGASSAGTLHVAGRISEAEVQAIPAGTTLMAVGLEEKLEVNGELNGTLKFEGSLSGVCLRGVNSGSPCEDSPNICGGTCLFYPIITISGTGESTGDILVNGDINTRASIVINGDMSGDIRADADGDGQGAITGQVTVTGVFDGDLCADNISATEPLPSNIDVKFGPNATVCDVLACRIFVDELAAGTEDGRSWENAFADFDSLEASGSYDTAKRLCLEAEYWLAEGVYHPATDPGDPRAATIQLSDSAVLLGGFPSGGGAKKDRDPVMYETVLSGDIGVPGDDSDNTYHVVTASGVGETAVLDGLTISGGNAVAVGEGYGGGIFVIDTCLTVSGCRFVENAATFGGAMYLQNSHPMIVDSIFRENTGLDSGGAIWVDASSSPQIMRSVFSNNSAPEGGGVYAVGDVSLANCVFSGNSALTYGGGMNAMDGTATLSNCTFSQNSAPDGYGGGLSGTGVITNSIFWGNTASGGDPQIHGSNTVSYSDVQGGYAGAGNIDLDPKFIDPDGADDVLGTVDDNLRLSAGAPCIDAGSNAAVPAGLDTDIGGRSRFSDDPFTDDTGEGTAPIVDMGAYENLPVRAVDASAPAGGDGLDWPTSLTHLNDALSVASDPEVGVTQIRVAGGTYRPDEGSGQSQGDRTASFALLDLVEVYGGYAGREEQYPNTRDLEAYESVLSGDIGVSGQAVDNSYHVVRTTGTTGTAVLDGLTITDGYADGAPPHDRGAGVYIDAGSVTLVDCVIDGNSAVLNGAGIFVGDSSPTFRDCQVRGNEAPLGGGVFIQGESNPVFVGCTFTGNKAVGGLGGAIYASGGFPTLSGCRLANNSALSGGALYNDAAAQLDLVNCVIHGNNVTSDGGGIWNDSGVVTLGSCTVSHNSAGHLGGGLLSSGLADTGVANSVVWGNTDGDPGGTGDSAQLDGPCTVTYSCIQDDAPEDPVYPGTGNIYEDPRFVDFDGADDILRTDDDDVRLYSFSPCIDTGSNEAVPADTLDLDGDGDTTEKTPFDLDLNLRIVDGDGDEESPGIWATVDMGSYELDCVGGAVEEPTHPAGSLGYAKNRFVSVLPGDASVLSALRVTLTNTEIEEFQDAIGRQWWVGTPFKVCENSGQGPEVSPPNCGSSGGLSQNWFWAAQLQCEPYYMDWTTLVDHCTGGTNDGGACVDDNDCPGLDASCGSDGAVHIYHQAVASSGWDNGGGTVLWTTYGVQAIHADCDVSDERNFSDSLSITMSRWGDIVGQWFGAPPEGGWTPPNNVVDLSDLNAMIEKFGNDASFPILKTICEFEPAALDLKVSIMDVVEVQGAFMGASYPWDRFGEPCCCEELEPCSCP